MYPIGLLTLDEAALAGLTLGTFSHLSYLSIKSSYFYWTMSPAKVWGNNTYNYYVSNGLFSNEKNRIGAGYARPAISLKNSVTISGGNGSFSEPYIINS